MSTATQSAATAPVATNPALLVVGGGIAGMTAALEAAECGRQVILVERSPTLGGRTALLYRYFPKMCHPTCGLEINLRRLRANRNVRVLTLAEVTAVGVAWSLGLLDAGEFVAEPHDQPLLMVVTERAVIG